MNDTLIYLDNNATTAVAPECIEAMTQCLREDYGNPSSKHVAGEAARLTLGNEFNYPHF